MATVTEVLTEPFTAQGVTLKSGPIKVHQEELPAVELSDIPLPPPSKEPTEVLSIDKPTPDYHVPRDPRLIRLTGVHPFNVEPPLTALYDEGTQRLSCCPALFELGANFLVFVAMLTCQ